MADSEKPKKGGALKWILLILFILLLGGGAAGGWYYFFSDLPGSKQASEKAQADVQVKTVAAAPAANLNTTVLPTFLVNLADPLGKRFIKLTVEVEITSPQVAQEIEKQKARIQDSIIMLLSSKSYADLASTENKLVLKNEIIDRLNQALGGPKVSRVFFVDLIIQ